MGSSVDSVQASLRLMENANYSVSENVIFCIRLPSAIQSLLNIYYAIRSVQGMDDLILNDVVAAYNSMCQIDLTFSRVQDQDSDAGFIYTTGLDANMDYVKDL